MKSIVTETLTALKANNSSLALMLKLDFPTVNRYNSTNRDIYWNEGGVEDRKYTGVGTLGSITAIEESSDLGSYSVQVSLSGIPLSPDYDNYNFYVDVMNVNYRGRAATLYVATLDDDFEIVGEPIVIFAGRTDTAVNDIGEEAKITLNILSRLADWERPRGGWFSNAYQQTYIDPNDKGFSYMEQLAGLEVIWGGNEAGDDNIGRTVLKPLT